LATDKEINEDWLAPLDVRDDSAVSRVFAEYRPDVVIHLAAETDLEYCETHPEVAGDTNSAGTRSIAKLCGEYGATLVYVSTAGVFDGKKEGVYTEADSPKPIMVYGRTKYDGELHALDHCRRTFVVRAGWMMGGGRRKEKKFIYKILKQIGDGRKELFAVDDRWGTPTYACDFAWNLFMLLRTGRYGVYHMVCEGTGTRHDVAQEILSICGIEDIALNPVGSDFFAEEYFVTRPRSEMMSNENLRKIGCDHMRSWKDSLKDYIEDFFPDYIRINGHRHGQTILKGLKL
jgi:dTDP-4-dehydrorhamnose reductase